MQTNNAAAAAMHWNRQTDRQIKKISKSESLHHLLLWKITSAAAAAAAVAMSMSPAMVSYGHNIYCTTAAAAATVAQWVQSSTLAPVTHCTARSHTHTHTHLHTNSKVKVENTWTTFSIDSLWVKWSEVKWSEVVTWVISSAVTLPYNGCCCCWWSNADYLWLLCWRPHTQAHTNARMSWHAFLIVSIFQLFNFLPLVTITVDDDDDKVIVSSQLFSLWMNVCKGDIISGNY